MTNTLDQQSVLKGQRRTATTISRHHTPPDQLLTYKQLAEWLNDTVRHLRRLVLERKIPYVKVGHYIRFDSVQIAGWLEAHRHDPSD
jgi:excisionase family DNA binding protein